MQNTCSGVLSETRKAHLIMCAMHTNSFYSAAVSKKENWALSFDSIYLVLDSIYWNDFDLIYTPGQYSKIFL